ncbi:LOW QUALITY PROTEIN: uncharacterized protein EMH_0093440 [Eimeria mitis]|uniref:Uncharacterized protein n=1 Tax=Eimeria mitis TaxID=44415 RepID=U6KF48_9EIME|nr:LOW QUALITY PROTEIN: uncharacterized protein EMH_0093440 [Eimeria mitis]CDJ36665.1 hypothetical protein, conserved [Eimeria mitis]
MNSVGGDVGGPWPDLAPPPEAVHLFHSYEDLKAQLLPLRDPDQQQPTDKFVSPLGSLHEADAFARESSLAGAAALLPQGSRSLLQPFSKSFIHSRDTAVSPSPPITRGSRRAASRKNEGPMSGEGTPGSVLGTPPLADTPNVPSENAQDPEGVSGLLEGNSSQLNEATAPRHTQSNPLPITSPLGHDVPTAQRRTRSSETFSGTFVKSRSRRDSALGGREQHEDSAGGTVPPEVESLLLRLQHRSCSTGTAAPFSWRRARERARAVAAAARSSSSSSCFATEGNWKFDGDMLVPGDSEKTKALRQEALKRVRQRAREARERQQQELLQQQLEQEQQHQRSQLLSKQLRQRTLQRIRENALKQEEERQQQELLQQQMMRQAEAQRQYCARHRKALQQRLLQQQQEIKDKIRMHAEESVSSGYCSSSKRLKTR